MFNIEDGILKRYSDTFRITDVVIPNGVTEIGESAFWGCEKLTSVIIPDTVIRIGNFAFKDCYSLKNISIPNSVITIGNGTFECCKSLTSISIPNSVIAIRNFVFSGCKSLTSVSIPNSVTTIEAYTFESCKSLSSVSIPNSVKTIEEAFYGCDLLQSKVANYKAFNLVDGNLVCRDYIFKDNEWSDTLDDIVPCQKGFHYCENLFEIFNFYGGKIDEYIAIYECEVGDEVIHTKTSKCCTNRIKPVKRLYREDIIKILNGGK